MCKTLYTALSIVLDIISKYRDSLNYTHETLNNADAV